MRRMHMAFAVLLTAAIMLGTSASVLTSAPDAASPAALAQPAVPLEPAQGRVCGPGEPSQTPGTEAACCIPECWRDKDCDRICGKNNGQCVPANSCCNVCACFS